MSFDLSRIRFNARQDFLGVIMQQGRVQLDADWNAWVTQMARRIQAGDLDSMGRAVVPRETTPNGFRIEVNAGLLTIHPGRIYIDGLLAENHGEPPEIWDPQLAEQIGISPVPYGNQPYRPDQPVLPVSNGPHLVYLDVWQREVTHLQDADLVEKAVGVDSTGRLQTVWQVKVLEDVGNITCETPDEDIPGWVGATRPALGRLSTSTGDLPGEPEPCQVPPAAGYLGLENQLYRVEVHTGGKLGGGADGATFKWSRDNATVASPVTHINPSADKLTVESIGRDDVLRFNDGDWVEVTDDWRELNNQPGDLRRIKVGGGVDDTSLTIELEKPLTADRFPPNGQGETVPARHTRLRRWDQAGMVRFEDGSDHVDLDAAGSNGEIPLPGSGNRLFLENGILVEFHLDAANGEFKSGDAWTFAARTADASIEILEEAPPQAIHHHYARLAIITIPDAQIDCRTLWPPLSEGESCACTICVTAESHNNGTMTIQKAIDELMAVGGTICLGIGTYNLRESLKITEASSLRIRGQGPNTIVVGTAPGTLIHVHDSSHITIENLALVGSAAGDEVRAMVSVFNVMDFRLERTEIFAESTAVSTTVGVELSGYVMDTSIRDCWFDVDRGIANGTQKGELLTSQFQASNNIMTCSQRGFSFTNLSLHIGTVDLSHNAIRNCRDACIVALGASLDDTSFNITSNLLSTRGSGIRAGVDGLRIQNNQIVPFQRNMGDGIVLEQGVDSVSLDHAQIIGNRILSMLGNGVVIRHRVENAMIKQNTISETMLSGIRIEEGGSAGHLVIENNSFLNLGASFRESSALAGLQLQVVDRADILNNHIRGVGLQAINASAVAGILGLGVGDVRVAGNTLDGIGPPRSSGMISAIWFVPPAMNLAIENNSVERAGDDPVQFFLSQWHALRIGGIGKAGENIPAGETSLGYVPLKQKTLLVTKVGVHIFEAARSPSLIAVRENRFEGESTREHLVFIEGARTCMLMENHCQHAGFDEEHRPLCHLDAMAINASNNRLIDVSRQPTLLLLPRQNADVVVLGNISTGPILVDGNPLGDPWLPLNVIGI